MDDKLADDWNFNEHCLFLLYPSRKIFSSSNKEGKELELFPVATERRYAEQAYQFIEQSLSSTFTIPTVLEKNQGSNEVDPLKMPKRQPPFLKFGSKPSMTASLDRTSTMNNGSYFPIPETKNCDVSRSKFPRTNTEFNCSYVTHQRLPENFASYLNPKDMLLAPANDQEEDSEEILLPSVYDPKEHVNTATQKDCSKANDFFATKYANCDMDIPFETVSGIDDLGFESMIRDGSMTDQFMDELMSGYGSYTSGVPRNPESMTAVKTVNAHQTNYSQARPEVQSVYADIYASNPFGVDFSTDNEGDLSIRATLFPSKTSAIMDLSTTKDVTLLETPNSSFEGSISSQSSEDDMTSMTKDFHRALSSIAKEKSRPLSSAFGLSTKAMSLLGQTEFLRDAKPCSKVQNSTKKQLSSLDSSSDINDDASLWEAHGSFTTKDRNTLGCRKKLQSILGIGVPALASNTPGSVSDSSQNGPRTNSSLFEKLYSQVLKPSDAYYPDHHTFNTEHESEEPRRLSNLGGFDGEPIKRTSLSSSNGTPAYRMPFGSSDSEGYDKTMRQRPTVKACPSSCEITNNQTWNTQTQSSITAYHHSLQNGAKMLNKSLGELIGKNSDSAHTHSVSSIRHNFYDNTQQNSSQIGREVVSMEHRSVSNDKNQTQGDFRKSPTISPCQQFQRLASVSESSGTATNFDQGLPFKRPRSPVKKMFSDTVEKIGRIIPVSNNANSAQHSHETSINSSSELKISIHPADQNRLFGDLEYIIQDTANRFLLYQHSHSRLSPQSIEKTARDWRQKNRPQVAQFLYPISIQRKLVEQNLDNITFHGPLAGNATAIKAIMHTWKYVAQELAVRSFCLPDAGLQHFLREVARLLELLGVTAGHMLHFQAWNNVVCRTVHANYQTPYSSHNASSI